MRTVLMAVLLATLAAACSGGGDAADDTSAKCAVTDDRGASCSRVCTAFTPADLPYSQLCRGATWDKCVDECVQGVSVTAWCP